MKRFYSKFRITLLTFAFGLASFWFVDRVNVISEEIPVDLPKAKFSSVIDVSIVEEGKDFITSGYVSSGKTKYEGEGYTKLYHTNFFRAVLLDRISYSNPHDRKLELDSILKDAQKVVSFSKNRIIIENSFDNKNWIEIIKLEDKKILKILTAPDLELALKFEKWLIDNN